jgi:hypothetical protein
MVCNWYVWDNWSLLFEDDAGRAVTVNADHCHEMLLDFLIPEWWTSQLVDTILFQQDSATEYMECTSMAILRQTFRNHLISSFGDLIWPSCSPDLTALDYFLWGYLKERVFAHCLQMIDN